jgi:hypothetical protein
MKRLEAECPKLATWLTENERQQHDQLTSLPNRLLAKYLKIWRGLQWRLFDRRAIRIADQ